MTALPQQHEPASLDRVISGLAWGLPEPFKMLDRELRGMRGLFLFDLLVALGQLVREPATTLEVRLTDAPLPRRTAKIKLVAESQPPCVELTLPDSTEGTAGASWSEPLSLWIEGLENLAREWREVRERRAPTELTREALHARLAFFEGVATLAKAASHFDGKSAPLSIGSAHADDGVPLLERYRAVVLRPFPLKLPGDLREVSLEQMTNGLVFPKAPEGGTAEQRLKAQLADVRASRVQRAHLSLVEGQLHLVMGDRAGGFIFQEPLYPAPGDVTFSPAPLHARLNFLERYRQLLKGYFWYAGGRLISVSAF